MEAAQGWMQVGRGMKPHDEGCCCRCCHFGLLYQYQQRSWLEMQTGSQVICGPPCHCNSNKQGTYKSWKDQDQIQKKGTSCTEILLNNSHQLWSFLFSFLLLTTKFGTYRGRPVRSDRSGLYSPSRIRLFVKTLFIILLMNGYDFPGL